MASQIPKARLNQIAERKLKFLGIATTLAQDGVSLQGKLAPGSAGPRHPLTGRPVEVVEFVVEGHDRLRLVAPVCVLGLPELLFLDLERAAQLLELLAKHLARRAAAVQQQAGRLRGLGLTVSVDAERLVALCRVELTALGTVELEADERGVRLTRLLSRAPSTRAPFSLGDTLLELQGLTDRTELELHLGQLVDQLARTKPVGQPAPTAPAPQQPRAPQPSPTTGALTLARLAERFGAEASVAAGVTLGREVIARGQKFRFTARHEQGRTFVGKLVSPAGTLWEERFDLDRFPGVEDFVAGFLGTAEVEHGAAEPAPQGKVVPAAELGHGGTALLPMAGEVWIMTVLVEQDDGAEVRYSGVDVDGQPFGAPRVLPKSAFDATFTVHGAGYRLLVLVELVEDGSITYVPLDPSRKPLGQQRTSRLPGFVVNFAPESAGY